MTYPLFRLEVRNVWSSKIVMESTNEGCSATGENHRLELNILPHQQLSHVVYKSKLAYLDDKPMKCECGYHFTYDDDSWGSTSKFMYRNPKTGKEAVHAHHIATAGAVWACPWLVDNRDIEDLRKGFSAILSRFYIESWLGKRPPLSIMCPDGSSWIIDQKASNGEGWQITGDWETDPITLHASPSIVVPGYHGWLHNGVLSDDLDGRNY